MTTDDARIPDGKSASAGVWRRAREFADRHPLLLSWVVLAVAMVAILVYTSRDVGLLPTQLLSMVIATILVAGACVWIISWD